MAGSFGSGASTNTVIVEVLRLERIFEGIGELGHAGIGNDLAADESVVVATSWRVRLRAVDADQVERRLEDDRPRDRVQQLLGGFGSQASAQDVAHDLAESGLGAKRAELCIERRRAPGPLADDL